MLDQETASVARFILDVAEGHKDYFDALPERFYVPSAYFPPPEIETRGDTLTTYAMSITWFVKFFASTKRAAETAALKVLTELTRVRGLVPLLDEKDGKPTGKFMRVYDPAVRPIEDSPGAAQLTLRWTSHRPYDEPTGEKAAAVNIYTHTRDKTEDTNNGD